MERVVGDERRDDQHDDGERQQLVAEEVHDLVELRFALIGLVLLGEDLDGGAQGALDGRDHRLQRGARRQPHIDAVVAPAAVQELPSRSHVPGDLLEREPVVGFQEVVVADQLEGAGAAGSGDLVALADLEAVVSGGVVVHGELVGPSGACG